MDRRGFLAAAAGGMAAALPLDARAAGKEPVKLAKAYPYLENFLKIPPARRNRFHVNYYLTLDGRPATAYRGAIIEGATRTPVTVEADGRLSRLPTLAQLQSSAQFQMEAPAETKFGLRMEIQASMAPATEFSATELAATIQQVAEAVKSAAGALALVAPKFSAAMFVGSVGGNAVTADGRNLPLIAGRFGPLYAPEKAPGAAKVILSKAPSRILLTPLPK